MQFSKTTMSVLAFVCGVFVAIPAAQAQTTWYVDHGNDCPGTGSLGDPFCLIQDGIDAAVNGDEVVVADGTYTGDGNRDLDFGGQDIHLRSENLDPELCIIDCEGTEGDPHRGVFFHNGETVQAEVHGFTITGGNVTNGGGVYCTSGSSPTITDCIFSGNSVSSNGGGMYCTSGSNPTVTGCTFDGNSATNGGGIYLLGSSPTISNCTFTENSVTGTNVPFNSGVGGAIRSSFGNPTIENCTFTRNTATAGSADHTGAGGAILLGASNDFSTTVIDSCIFIDNMAIGGVSILTGVGGGLNCFEANAILSDCIFVGNTATHGSGLLTGLAGALVFAHVSVPEITNCTFIGNSALGESGDFQGIGGGMWLTDTSPVIKNCIFGGNVATGEMFASGTGGGIAVTDGNFPDLSNCALIGNHAAGEGGGMYFAAVNTPITAELTNCTLSGNNADGSGGGIFSTTNFGGAVVTRVDNSIAWFNTPDQIVDESGDTTTVTYSDVQGGWDGPGEGNIDADPLFTDGPSGTWTADGVYLPDEGQTILTDANATWGKDPLEGMFINPNMAQTLQSLIVDNDATTLTVWADFTDLVALGGDYQIHDYHLMDGSPCIDAAKNAAVPEGIETDLDGNPRFVDDPDTEDCQQAPGTCGDCPVVDMGAYEYQDGSTECCGDCPTDSSGDGNTGAPDLAQLLACWGPIVAGCECFDANGDGDMGPLDLATLLAAWGPCP